MLLRRRMMGKSDGLLPAGYTQVEYIENTSTAYIDTGVLASSEISLTLDFYYSATNGNRYLVGGSDINTADTPRVCFYMSYGTPSYAYNTTLVNNWSRPTISNLRLQLSINSNIVELDNGTTKYTYTVGEDTFTTDSNILFLTSSWLRNIQSSYATTGKIYGATIGNVRNFVPCISPNNVVGLYDTIGNQFYSSPNGVEFVAGNPV